MVELQNYQVLGEADNLTLTIPNAKAKIKLPGLVLEKGFELPSCYSLWLTTDDCPYEETLFVSLVNSQGCVVDKLEIYKPYTPGVISEVVVVSGNCIQFKFWQGLTHSLSVSNNKINLSHVAVIG